MCFSICAFLDVHWPLHMCTWQGSSAHISLFFGQLGLFLEYPLSCGVKGTPKRKQNPFWGSPKRKPYTHLNEPPNARGPENLAGSDRFASSPVEPFLGRPSPSVCFCRWENNHLPKSKGSRTRPKSIQKMGEPDLHQTGGGGLEPSRFLSISPTLKNALPRPGQSNREVVDRFAGGLNASSYA